MISASLEGDCALWDAQKMIILQTIRKPETMKTKLSMSCFNQVAGTLFLATSEVYRYDLKENNEVKIQTD